MKNKKLVDLIDTAKTAVILGLGTTGIATAKFFLRMKKNVIVIEKQSREQFTIKPIQAKTVIELEKSGVQISFLDQIPDAVLKLDTKLAIVVISPGISLTTKVAKTFKEKNFTIIGELELGLGLSGMPHIMVTGSNGKSTCVSLINAIFQASDEAPYLCGNIGNPILNLLDDSVKESPSVLVVEASSYQLEAALTVKPDVSVFLNLTENHLERHGTLEKYLHAKTNVAINQTIDQVSVLNADDPYVMSIAPSLKSTIALFGVSVKPSQAKHTAVIEYDPARALDRVVVTSSEWGNFVFECADTKLVGEHARYNIAAASLAVLSLPGDRVLRSKAIQKAISVFKGLDHRLQPVATQSGMMAINDSKSTTVASTVAALRSVAKAYPNRPIQLMIGGKVKIGSWKPLSDEILELGAVVRVICFGGDGLFIQQELQQYGIQAYLAKNVAIATTYASDWMRDNEVLLFSPGCASFDEFSNFEERGKFFSSVVGLR